MRDRPADEPLDKAVIEAVVEQYTTEPAGDALTLITSAPSLRAEFVATVAGLESPLASAIAARAGIDDQVAKVLAAAVSAAARIAVEQWVQPVGALVVVRGVRLADLLRETLAHVAPALRAVDPIR